MDKTILLLFSIVLFVLNVDSIDNIVTDEMKANLKRIRQVNSQVNTQLNTERATKELINQLTANLDENFGLARKNHKEFERLFSQLPKDAKSHTKIFKQIIPGVESDIKKYIQDFKSCINEDDTVDQEKFEKTAEAVKKLKDEFEQQLFSQSDTIWAVPKIQAYVRGNQDRKKFQELRRSAVKIEAAMRDLNDRKGIKGSESSDMQETRNEDNDTPGAEISSGEEPTATKD